MLDTTGQARWTGADVIQQEYAIEAASRWIDQYCDTRFYTSTFDETRYYTADNWRKLFITDDLLSITTFKTDDDDDGTYETTWATSDYLLKPTNAALDGEPYRWIEVDYDSSYSLPILVQNGVQIIGKFGYSSGVSQVCPAPVRQACLLLSARMYRRKDAILGVAGTSALGTTGITSPLGQDLDVIALLNGISRRGGFF
jgi:hypothetical protein